MYFASKWTDQNRRYSFLHNPNPNYEETLRCTQEVVFPLYTMVFVFYALCGALMLLVRPCITSRDYMYLFDVCNN